MTYLFVSDQEGGSFDSPHFMSGSGDGHSPSHSPLDGASGPHSDHGGHSPYMGGPASRDLDDSQDIDFNSNDDDDSFAGPVDDDDERDIGMSMEAHSLPPSSRNHSESTVSSV